jgi:hypothetical protein
MRARGKISKRRRLAPGLNLQKNDCIILRFGLTKSDLDKAGNEVGVWYSAIRAAAVKIDKNGQIVNLSPLRTVAIGDQVP